jgi:hypothetical protein
MALPRRARGRSRPRLTGLSILLAGASWDWTESERDAVRDLVIFLEDRRALSAPHHREYSEHVIASVLEIRAELTKTLQRMPESAKSASLLRDMRSACSVFLDAIGAEGWVPPHEFSERLGELRGVFGVNLAVLVEKFGIEIHGPLQSILPRSLEGEDE